MVGEASLIQNAQGGDVEAFNALVLTYQDQVYTVAYRIMNDPASADDITQETFVTAFRKLNQFREGNFRAWLLRIATNRCYDELRKYKRHPHDSIDDDDAHPESDSRLQSKSESPEQATQRGELRSAIEECFQQLSAAHRLVAVMADLEEQRYEDIAASANISVGTVKSRLSRARARLRDCLRGKGELLPAQYRQ